ncbi:leucine-rich repeat domain-containing protein [Spongiactinospora rosea]|uniref:Leucine-rich repeat domain-containing protein n=1 Tax=Spongiactinospora rosea TaxID=2248750 RepID=A0A366LSL0_9ACTN|nr:STM4015 family protein [Spongiactinospora rosea]RBQ16182.1 leucine-rich repeat domain-containing protein [Spongiactinospora rosea]
MIHQHLTEFHGLPVHEVGDEVTEPRPLAAEVAWRVAGDDFDDEFEETFAELLETVDCAAVRALVVGTWGWAHDDRRADVPIGLLIEAAPRFPALEAIFLGDYVSEESEISWIGQSDVTPLLTAYPRLKRLDVRGGDGLAFQAVDHAALETLRFETGGLPADVVRAVGASTLPALRHLELWLGTENYSGDSGPDDWAPILAGRGLPALRHLGLQDSERQDDVATAVATAPIVARLESLDLSMGTLSDAGAEALLTGQPLTHLKRLNLRHHYLSAEMSKRVLDALADVEVDLSDEQDFSEHNWRYIEVSE